MPCSDDGAGGELMEFGLTEDDEAVIERAASFARGFGGSAASPAWSEWGEGGWAGLCIPAEFGGSGTDALATVLAFEALGGAGIDRGSLFALGAHLFGFSMAIANHGSPEQKAGWLPRLAKGEFVGALAFTEPGGGSNLDGCSTALVADDGGYRLTGRKTFITNGATADLYLVLARSREERSPFAYSMVVVPRDTVGLSVVPLTGVRGMAETVPAHLTFDDCRVPGANMLRRKDMGMAQLLDIMRWERSCILAGSLGALQSDLDRVVRHFAPRQQYQAIGHSLARIRTKAEAARWLMLRAAWELDHGGKALLYPAMGKLFVSETIAECTLELRRLLAGAGWQGDLGLTDALDDALAILSASGTSEVQLNTISSQMGGGV